MYQLYRDRPLLVLCIVLANLALSGWCFAIDPVINNDGVTYLSMAQLMLDGQWQSAFSYYSWPYYSVFIAATAKLFFLDVETAAYLLNTVFVTSLTIAFVCIVSELSDNNKRVILIAMVVVLLFPSITKYRAFIIRDFGYLSCYLWSLYFIFRFCSTLKKSHLIGWLVFAALSCLFRIEGIAFLLIAPYFLLLFTNTRIPHRRMVLSTLSLVIIVASLSLLMWYIDDKYSSIIETAKASGKNINNIADLFFANIKDRLGGEALTPLSSLKIIASNTSDVIYELVRRMAVFYFLFALWAYMKGDALKNRLIKRVWLVFVITNFIMLCGFSVYNNFLVSRYTMATALTLLILAPFVIDRLCTAYTNNGVFKRTLVIAVIVLLGLVSLEGLDVRTNKMHVKEAGLWVKNEIPQSASLYSNDKLVIYYAGHSAKENLDNNYNNLLLRTYISTRFIRNYEYIAISVDPKDAYDDFYRQTLAYLFGLPIKISDAGGGRALFIFKNEQYSVRTDSS